jgi:hypothetical protein
VLNWLKNRLTKTVDTTLTIESHSGAGALSCNDCGHLEQVHLFTHGFGPTSQCAIGYQCQSCAKFVTFDSEPVGDQGMAALKELVKRSRCECGGKYARDKPVMCPRCKSVKVEYDLGMVT